MFFWAQHDNLTWGFQSQFFLAFILPLAAIVLLWKSQQSDQMNIYFLLSLIAGVASVGTMANGVLALPLLFLYSLLLKNSWQKTFLLFLVSVCCLTLYFHEYTSPSGHGSVLNAIKTDCFGLVRYMARYIGSPLTYVVGAKGFKPIAELMGFFVLFFTLYQIIVHYLRNKTQSLSFALIIFLIFVVATAFCTAGGRLIFGLDQAFESRYTTPAIMVWSAILLISIKYIQDSRKLMGVVLGFFLICMLPEQIKALKNKTSQMTERNLAALSLALNIEDEEQIKSILPSAKWGLELSKTPREKGYSIFGYGDIHNLVSSLDSKSAEIETKNQCDSKVYVDKVKLLTKVSDEKNQYMSISGWIFNPSSYSNNDAIQIDNAKRSPVGVGFVGIERPDVASIYGKVALYSGFKAYLKFEKNNKDFYIRKVDDLCWTSFKIRLPEM